MKHTNSPGADGWRVAELQALPLYVFENLVEVLKLVEETGTWLVSVTQGLRSLIPEGAGSALEKLGPTDWSSWRPCAGCGLR